MSWILIALLCAIVLGYAFFAYRNTIPVISGFKRGALALLRFLAVFGICFLIAEPVANLTYRKIIKPAHLIFIDESRSMTSDSTAGLKQNVTKEFIHKLSQTSIDGDVQYYSFGADISAINRDSLGYISFDQPVTNFSKIFEQIRNRDEKPASITIISDGIVTDGIEPISAAESFAVPVFTIVAGDTITHNDLMLKEITANDILYAGQPASIRLNLFSNGISQNAVRVQFYDEDKLIETRSLSIQDGANLATFAYTPQSADEKKLTFKADVLSGETNIKNNQRSIFVSVKNNKQKAILIAGFPSADLAFIKNSLIEDTNITVKEIVEIGNNKFLSLYQARDIDSADVLFLINYPQNGSSAQLFNDVSNAIKDKHKPFFLLMSEDFSAQLINSFEDQLPIKIKQNIPGSLQVQPILVESNSSHPLVKSGDVKLWDDLPPIYRPNSEFIAKPESDILLKMKTQAGILNAPLLVSRNIGTSRSAVLLARDIWRWKLLDQKPRNVFSNFIHNSFKWLEAGADRQRLIARSDKKYYEAGEKALFTAELYDESFNPVPDGAIALTIESTGMPPMTLTMNSIGNGFYESIYPITKAGDYRFKAVYQEGVKKALTASGRFVAGIGEIEFRNTITDAGMMKLLSNITGGKFYFNMNHQNYFDELARLNKRMITEKRISRDTALWNDPWLLVVLIIFFSIEWFIRKREGML
jgi:hypothetical protein